MKKRKYTLKQRAAQQERTRQRIVDAAMALHENPGPAYTTVSALAEKAGVQRLTVYKHFPTEQELFGACSSKWLEQHPPPDVSAIGATGTRERTQAVLLAVYGYYRETQGMWSSVYRDLQKIPALAGPVTAFESYLAAVAKDLLAAWAPPHSRQLRATVFHALQFSTWQSLSGRRLSLKAMAQLVSSWASAAASSRRREAG